MATIDLRHVRTPEQARRVMDAGLAHVPTVCRWCRAPHIRNTPCSCERAQQEVARIRADTR